MPADAQVAWDESQAAGDEWPAAQVARDEWLDALIARSPLMADMAMRRHWRRLVPRLPTAARFELASVLLDAERAWQTD
ncbi:MAG: hypothetical protein JO057_03170 [Chloroflexi bacterium]|nr:hypothetical protein [Chloroflexota bacterium]